jgi:ubiquinone/menaquinone biosynthesis C-methylase UbiE
VLLNHIEFALMNNPLRTAIQRRFEAERLLLMGGRLEGGAALEIGCGSGAGAAIILERFCADRIHAFDLDPRMVARARRRLSRLGPRARLWVGDATAIAVAAGTYDAVFDFGMIHHVPEWRKVLREVARVLKPGGRFYAEEVLASFIRHPIARRLLEHPQADRFDAMQFQRGLEEAGLERVEVREFRGVFAWFTATRSGHP